MIESTDQQQKERLGDVLVRTGIITQEQLREALHIGRSEKKKIGQVLIEKKFISPRDLATALSIQLQVPLIDLTKHKVLKEALKLVPEQLARKYSALPLDIIGDSMTIAMEDTGDVRAIDDLAAVTKKRIEPMMGVPEDIRRAIDRNYAMKDVMEDVAQPVAQPVLTPLENVIEDIGTLDDSSQAPAMRSLNLIIQQAIRCRASDIHIEPQENKLQVRYRIDGVLQSITTIPSEIHAALMSRLKIMGGMNIAERRRPQDGRFSVRIDNEDTDVRVAVGNTVQGEMAVLRLLSKSPALLELTGLGFLPDALDRYQKLLKLPWGMILFGGPTGSGKTTTLYASINQLDRAQRNIMTIEDPVEYHFSGINQFQVNTKAGLTFATGLRSFMRLDPDVMLVGEIRDIETASTAIQASLTGHLLFSSIHANDSAGIIFRLVDLGVDLVLLCSAISGTVSQRIVRRICPHCLEYYEPTLEEKAAYEAELGELTGPLLRGGGCNACSETGYLGRVGLFEVLIVTDNIKKLLLSDATAVDVRNQAEKEGMVSLVHDGMLKVQEGITTISEVLRNVYTINL
jgi:general secretion pathway protein E